MKYKRWMRLSLVMRWAFALFLPVACSLAALGPLGSMSTTTMILTVTTKTVWEGLGNSVAYPAKHLISVLGGRRT